MERQVEYKFKLEIEPNIAEISFNGKYMIISPEQRKIDFILFNFPKALDPYIKNYILKNSLKHAEQIANEYGIYFPPR